MYSLCRESLLERKKGQIYFSMSKWTAGTVFRRSEKVFSKGTSRNIEALSWKHVRRKGDFLMGTFSIFSYSQLKSQSQQFPSDSFMDHTICCSYKKKISRKTSNVIWKNNTRVIPNFHFFSGLLLFCCYYWQLEWWFFSKNFS